MRLDDPVSPEERSRALQSKPAVVRRAARRRRIQALLAAGTAAVAVSLALPLALAGGGKGQSVRVVGNPPTTTAVTAPPSTAAASAAYPREILAPASLPPVSDECTLALTHDADGNVSPLLCPNGGVNVLAWRYFAAAGGSVTLALGRAATSTEVLRAMCSDYLRISGTNPLTDSLEKLAAAYNGWRFTTDPTTLLPSENCSTSVLQAALRTSPNPVAPGRSLIFTITVTDISPSPVVQVVARLSLPAGVRWVTWSNGCQGQGPTFLCSMPNAGAGSRLGPGQSATAEITTTVDPSSKPGSFPTTVTVTATLGGPSGVPLNVSASTDTTVT